MDDKSDFLPQTIIDALFCIEADQHMIYVLGDLRPSQSQKLVDEIGFPSHL